MIEEEEDSFVTDFSSDGNKQGNLTQLVPVMHKVACLCRATSSLLQCVSSE